MSTPKRKIRDIEEEPKVAKPKTIDSLTLIRQLYESRPSFYGGENPAEMQAKIKELHKFYEQLGDLLST